MNTAKSCTFQGQMCDRRPLNTAEHVLTLAFYKTDKNKLKWWLWDCVCYIWPSFRTAGCGWAVDACSLWLHILHYWVLLWRSNLLFLTGTHKYTAYALIHWYESLLISHFFHRNTPTITTVRCQQWSMLNWLTERTVKQRMVMSKWNTSDVYVGKASKCTANGESQQIGLFSYDSLYFVASKQTVNRPRDWLDQNCLYQPSVLLCLREPPIILMRPQSN